jgi:hypothetical protein
MRVPGGGDNELPLRHRCLQWNALNGGRLCRVLLWYDCPTEPLRDEVEEEADVVACLVPSPLGDGIQAARTAQPGASRVMRP